MMVVKAGDNRTEARPQLVSPSASLGHLLGLVGIVGALAIIAVTIALVVFVRCFGW